MTLYGVGLGPGDPKLVTVKGARILEEATTVFAPGELAARLGSPYTDSIERLEFPMTENREALEAAWAEAAETVAPIARDGDVAFATVGDPNVYSTFSYLEDALETYPEVDVRTVPGVSVVTAFATVLDARIDASSLAVREAKAGVPDRTPAQLLLLKVTDVPGIHADLTEAGYEVTYGRRLFMDEPTVTSDPDELAESDYFTIAYAEQATGGTA
ncbi:MAG: cobalt-factor II C(20)-methyltransferase [Halodesulfurarchaeum sp.]|nr:cobalt-factor II C(20)-methyltransferase [Halodesulfurarchaeum sp.]